MSSPDKLQELHKLENQLCFPLYACAKEAVRQYRKPLEDLNLTYTQYIVMMTLWEYGEMTESIQDSIRHERMYKTIKRGTTTVEGAFKEGTSQYGNK